MHNQKAIANIYSFDFPINQNFVREIKAPFPMQRAFKIQKCKHKGIKVIATAAIEKDLCLWLHVSFACNNKMPDYSDISFIKQQFFGDDLKAIMVFPKRTEHINLHQYCLHLWANLTQDDLPDFKVSRVGI